MIPTRQDIDRHLAATPGGVRHRCDDCYEVFRNATEAYRPLAPVACQGCEGTGQGHVGPCDHCHTKGTVPNPDLIAKLYPFLAHWPEPEKVARAMLNVLQEGATNAEPRP